MDFSSLIFLFVFLAVNIITYIVMGAQKQNKVLLIFSLIFYAWGGPRYLLLLAGETLIGWLLAIRIDEARAGYTKRSETFYLVCALSAIILCLIVFRYLGFILGTTNGLFGVPESVPSILLPVGIAVYTLQIIAYMVDVYRGSYRAQRDYRKLLLYTSMFYQSAAGPVVRYDEVSAAIDDRHVKANDVYVGVRRFAIGLAKLAILAGFCSSAADTLLSGGAAGLKAQTTLGIWLGMIFYGFQIYFEFSGYADIAIGLGRMTGFRLPENFNYPYMAASVSSFTQRWNMTLLAFFRDYLYLPLGGNKAGAARYIRNMAIVWLLTGLWYGTGWHFVIWGAYFLVFLLLEKFWLGGRFGPVLSRIYTLLVVLFGWMIFRFESISEFSTAFAGMFGIGNAGFADGRVGTVFVGNIFLLVLAALACTDLGRKISAYVTELGKVHRPVFIIQNIYDMLLPAFLIVISALSMAGM